MTEPQDFESLDELFRKTFDNLPENPAPNGWDHPSERVWQHVQATVQPPKAGWSAQAITLVSALAVTVAVGLYLFVTRPVAETNLPAAPETTVRIEEKAVVAAPPAELPESTVAVVPPVEKVKVPGSPATIRPVPRSNSSPETNSVENRAVDRAITIQRPAASVPLPGSKDVPPNNTVDKLERLWETPLNTLPVLPEQVAPNERDLPLKKY